MHSRLKERDETNGAPSPRDRSRMRSRNPFYIFVARHRLGLAFVFFGCLFILTNLHLLGSTRDFEDPEKLREEILRLSELYVNVLSRDTHDFVDDSFSGRLTGHDLRKTLAVILDSLLNRISRLEYELARVKALNCSKRPTVEDSKVKDDETIVRMNDKDGDDNVETGVRITDPGGCNLTAEEMTEYPSCQTKMQWMAGFWSSDPCYATHGVNGTSCSFRIYLSEVESWCPPVPGRQNMRRLQEIGPKAAWNFSLEHLISLLHDPGHRKNYEWIRNRIKLLWDRWVVAAKNLAQKQNFTNRQQQRILIHLGFLSSKSGFKIPETASKGGPLGELVQWSDIISALYLLGHNLTITSEYEDLISILDHLPNAETQCQVRSQLPVDMIYTDIVGLIQFKKKVKSGYGKFSCLLRIIDSFGTEAMFNHAAYAKKYRHMTPWGKQDLNLRQFFTMFPHSPDNSFMGFVVEQHLMASEYENVTRKRQAVVYGKSVKMWKGKEAYLSVLKNFVDIHATVFLEDPDDQLALPQFVKNHGILSGPELHRLLLESKLFIGLGFPYEGPAPLEAIAQGCVFLNPKFDPPHNRQNTAFFKQKPTMRKVTSQHPYAEDFISEPHVYTLNINDRTEVESVIKKALKMVDENKVGMLLPYEFTHEGMLQRLNAYIQHQDFCSPHAEVWPPASSVVFMASAPGQSCKDACWEKRKICEYSHFRHVNHKDVVELLLDATCSSVDPLADIYFPAFERDTRRCFLQSDQLLFSCVGEVEGVSRVCPCRDFIRGQTALCKDCL